MPGVDGVAGNFMSAPEKTGFSQRYAPIAANQNGKLSADHGKSAITAWEFR
jgi:hypothetical protein